MEAQGMLFDAPPQKRVAETSKAVYREMSQDGTLDRRQRMVLESLDSYPIFVASEPPTIRELHRWMQECGCVGADPNSIKPRCTELKESGLIEFGEKRRCGVTHKRVFTITITERGRLMLAALKRRR